MGTKYIFVTGGVVSGLGKGITAASLGRLLKNRGYKVTIQKFDPYINVDPGTMSPYEHGEVFVTDDGAETDLDLGHYERFIDENLTKDSSITMGKIYSDVINKERKGNYLGKTVQVIPHVTDEIKKKIYSFEGQNKDIVIIEIGGTVGDIEGLPIIEAIRQVGLEKPQDDVLYIHVTLLPYITGSNELKSKPTQHSVRELQSYGIRPDILVCRTEKEISKDMKAKIGLFCNVRKEDVIQNKTASCLYEVPLLLEEEGLGRAVCNHLRLNEFVPNNTEWEEMVKNFKKAKENKLKVAIVGKYTKLGDAYLSVVESLKHAGFKNQVKIDIDLVDSETIKQTNVEEKLNNYDAIIVPGGFGERGIEGMITAIKYARENRIPFLGICLGMQLAVIEYVRNVLELQDVNSEEFEEFAKNKVIHLMGNQKDLHKKGGTMRLGAYKCKLRENTLAKKIYCDQKEISERHRHRYEYNNDYERELEKSGLISSGKSPDGKLVEIVEMVNHPFFVGTQFHPEFKSRPNNPAPMFNYLIKVANNIKNNVGELEEIQFLNEHVDFQDSKNSMGEFEDEITNSKLARSQAKRGTNTVKDLLNTTEAKAQAGAKTGKKRGRKKKSEIYQNVAQEIEISGNDRVASQVADQNLDGMSRINEIQNRMGGNFETGNARRTSISVNRSLAQNNDVFYEADLNQSQNASSMNEMEAQAIINNEALQKIRTRQARLAEILNKQIDDKPAPKKRGRKPKIQK